MLLFIETYPYNLNHKVRDSLTIRDILKDVVSVPEKVDTFSLDYVGYCYSKTAKDVIFFLPKVVLTGEETPKNANDTTSQPEKDTIFGASPEKIVDFEFNNIKTKSNEEEDSDYRKYREYREFLSTLSIWIYRVICVFRQTHHDSSILESREYQTESRGKKQKHNTLLDVIIALRDFNRDNQEYFTFIAKNMHSGYNRINWNRTITSSPAILQNGRPVYIAPVNRKKVINFDEELMVIYFSILNYIRETHGFSLDINLQYDLISPDTLKRTYIDRNLGCRRLRQIKYKYFSDKALRIWDLCYAFFDREYKIAMNRQAEDYLLAGNFEIIFEAMIDTLIGGEDKGRLPKELFEQRDGKLVDHMFIGQGLIERSDIPAERTYYIGDSKYYKRAKDGNVTLRDNSIYKQYTYARNVIQWNMNLFLSGDDSNAQPQLRDPLTEGYNPIPNFFISARIPSKNSDDKKFLSFEDRELKPQENRLQLNRQFENRLFDRDTLLLCHYDVNFLFIVSLYGRNSKNKQAAWREYARKIFRSKIQGTLNSLYSFRILQPRSGMDCHQFIQDNFQRLNGKLYRPQSDGNYLVLALMKEEDPSPWPKLNVNQEIVRHEIDTTKELLDSLSGYFHVGEPVQLEDNLHIERAVDIGTLDELPKREKKNILTGFVRKQDIVDYKLFSAHCARMYTMEKIPTKINIANIEYFLPMVAGEIDGYYRVEKVFFSFINENRPCLKLNLSTFIPLGESSVKIYGSKMQPGELIPHDLMVKLYEQKI